MSKDKTKSQNEGAGTFESMKEGAIVLDADFKTFGDLLFKTKAEVFKQIERLEKEGKQYTTPHTLFKDYREALFKLENSMNNWFCSNLCEEWGKKYGLYL